MEGGGGGVEGGMGGNLLPFVIFLFNSRPGIGEQHNQM